MKQNKKGASMILALVFLLFCTFVGGSVLAKASANGTRISKLREQQNILDQQSACLFAADTLRVPYNHILTLTAMKAETDTQKMEILPGGGQKPVGEKIRETKSYFMVSADFPLTPMQRIQLETTILHCIEEWKTDPGTVILEHFDYQDSSLTSPDDFWSTRSSDTIRFQGTAESGWQFADFEADCISGAAGGDCYDFDIVFGDDSLRKVHLASFSASYPYEGGKRYVKTGTDTYSEIEILPGDYTVISWTAPQVTKGGAGS